MSHEGVLAPQFSFLLLLQIVPIMPFDFIREADFLQMRLCLLWWGFRGVIAGATPAEGVNAKIMA